MSENRGESTSWEGVTIKPHLWLYRQFLPTLGNLKKVMNSNFEAFFLTWRGPLGLLKSINRRSKTPTLADWQSSQIANSVDCRLIIKCTHSAAAKGKGGRRPLSRTQRSRPCKRSKPILTFTLCTLGTRFCLQTTCCWKFKKLLVSDNLNGEKACACVKKRAPEIKHRWTRTRYHVAG